MAGAVDRYRNMTAPGVDGAGAAAQQTYVRETDRLGAMANMTTAAANAYAAEEEAARKSSQQQMLYNMLGYGNWGPGLMQQVGQNGWEEQYIQDANSASKFNQTNLVNNMGGSQQANIYYNAGNAEGTALSRLEDRGLGSSTLAGNAIASVNEQKNRSLLELEDHLLSQKLGVEQQTNANIVAGMQGNLERDQQNKQLQNSYASLLSDMWG